MRILLLSSLLVTLAACGGGANQAPAPAAEKPRFETRWLRGISATEVKTIAQSRGLTCQGPTLQGGTNVWTCTARTPLVDYRVQFYGSAPLKLEYITATIAQVGTATPDLVTPLFVGLAGLHYDGGDAQQARIWVSKAIAAPPADTTIGPGKFKVSGDLQKMTLDIKASGSDW